MTAKQQKLFAAILANLRAGVCTVAVMQRKAAEQRQKIAGCDLWLADPKMASLHDMCRKDRANYLATAEATEAACAAFLAA